MNGLTDGDGSMTRGLIPVRCNLLVLHNHDESYTCVAISSGTFQYLNKTAVTRIRETFKVVFLFSLRC